MAAMGGMTLFVILLIFGFGCIIPAAVCLIGCSIYKKRTGKRVHFVVRILLWGILLVGGAAAAVPAMYLFLILSNW